MNSRVVRIIEDNFDRYVPLFRAKRVKIESNVLAVEQEVAVVSEQGLYAYPFVDQVRYIVAGPTVKKSISPASPHYGVAGCMAVRQFHFPDSPYIAGIYRKENAGLFLFSDNSITYGGAEIPVIKQVVAHQIDAFVNH